MLSQEQQILVINFQCQLLAEIIIFFLFLQKMTKTVFKYGSHLKDSLDIIIHFFRVLIVSCYFVALSNVCSSCQYLLIYASTFGKLFARSQCSFCLLCVLWALNSHRSDFLSQQFHSLSFAVIYYIVLIPFFVGNMMHPLYSQHHFYNHISTIRKNGCLTLF